MNQSLSWIWLGILYDPWPIHSSILLILCLLGFLVTLISITSPKLSLIAKIVNAYPAVCFVLMVVAKTYDKFFLSTEVQRVAGNNFLLITWINLFAELYFFVILPRRPAPKLNIFSAVLAIVSSLTFFIAFWAEVDHV
jgi:hypothetical protein